MALLAGVNMTTYDKYYKTLYIGYEMMDAMIFSDPWMKEVDKLRLTRPAVGNKQYIPYQVGRSPAVSRDFSTAQAIAKATTGARGNWEVTIDSSFGVGRVDEKTILSTKNDEGAFKRALQDEINSAIYSMKNIREQDFFAPKPNQKGVVGSKSGSTVTLLNKWQTVNFDRNDRIEFYSPAATPVARTGNPYIVRKVNYGTGVIEF